MTIESSTSSPRTARGRATRERIVAAAAMLMYARGVAGTSLDDVCAATATSKSQLYHYFADKSALVCAVIAYQRREVLAGQQPYLGEFSTMAGLEDWRDRVVSMNGQAATYGGCPIGSIASEVGDVDHDARDVAMGALGAWRNELAAGLERMRAAGELPAWSDPEALAVGLLAAVQGGLLLAQAQQDLAPLEMALDHALDAVAALTKKA